MATENTVNFTLEVTAPPGWFLAIAPAALKVAQGTPAVFTLTATAQGGYASTITFGQVMGLPAGVVATIAPATIAQNGTATVTIPTTAIPVGPVLALQLKASGV